MFSAHSRDGGEMILAAGEWRPEVLPASPGQPPRPLQRRAQPQGRWGRGWEALILSHQVCMSKECTIETSLPHE